jgi:chlorite dismutase/nitrite reductase/ring-hydroxylating ferredoxin subunit
VSQDPVGQDPSPDRHGNGSSDAPIRRQIVKFSFFRVDASWRLLSVDDRNVGKQAFAAAVDSFSDHLQVRSYSCAGTRGDADFLLWQIGERLEDIQGLHTALMRTAMGAHLSMPYSYLAMTRRSVYVSQEEGSSRLHLHPADSKYFFVYPFVKTRAWYQLPLEERQAMMNDHIRVGRKYRSVKLNTTYSFGLDDQEFVVSFETDEPADFLDLVMELREAKSSLYTLRDTPTFTCISMSLRDTLDAIGAPGDAVSIPGVASVDGWVRAAGADEIPEGGSALVYVAGEQVALFNVGGRFYAIGNRCPHANGPLVEGTLDGATVSCPLHGSRFDLATGEPLHGPANRPARTFGVRIEGGDVFIGPKAAVPADL